MSLGGVGQARDVVVRALTSKQVGDAFGEDYPVGTTYEIVPDYTNSAPIILFTVEAATPDVATEALSSLIDRVPVELEKLQAGLDLPAAQRVTSVVLTRDEVPGRHQEGDDQGGADDDGGARRDGPAADRPRRRVADRSPRPRPGGPGRRGRARASAPRSLHPVHADEPAPDRTDPDRAAPAAVTARLVKRRRRRDERGEAS